MKNEMMILIILCFLALAGGIAILRQLLQGFRKTNLNDHYVWGIYVQGCFYLSSLATGILMILSAAILLDVNGAERLADVGSVIAFSLLFGSQILLGIDLGKPSRAILMIKSNNFHSPLTWDFYTLGLATVLSLVFFLGVLPDARGITLAWALLCLITANLCLAVHTMFFLSRTKGGYQTNAFSGLETLIASLLGGTAFLILTTSAGGLQTPAPGIHASLPGLLLILAVLLLGASVSHKIALLKQNHQDSKAVLILNLLIILLLLAKQFTENFLPSSDVFPLLAAVLSLVLVFIEKFHAVILPQQKSMIPEPYSQFQDKRMYHPSAKETQVLIGCFAICAFVGYGLLYMKAGF
ncbi:MAG: polysulfide reductase [Bacillota bacterium]|nr:polysulfide reductase [Bacillota bacterium]